MIGALARRLLSGLLAVLIAALLAFVILESAPGDAAAALLGDEASAEQQQAVRARLGLDQPLPARFARFLAGAVQGDLGVSVASGRPVAVLIGQRFANTLALACAAMLLALLGGLGLGVWSAARQNSPGDLALLALTAVCLATPAFGAALLLTNLFSVRLGWLPVVGGGTLKHLVLPAVSLAVPAGAVITRVVRAAMLEAARKPYTVAAYAKGLTAGQVWRRHVLRCALIPALTLAGIQFGHLLGGAFIVETLFGWPGLGRLTVQAIFDRDYPVVLGAVLLSAVIFQLLNILVDQASRMLDPRQRAGG